MALALFEWQSKNNLIYKQYIDLIGVNPSNVKHYTQIPFLPVEFFKEHKIVSGKFEAEEVFTSSATTGSAHSRHYVKSFEEYLGVATYCFEYFRGSVKDYCHLALLPSYLERTGSSLIDMVRLFISESKYEESGFFLREYEDLNRILNENERRKIPTILWGVTFALLDFSEVFKGKLENTMIIETGGMKGRRKELTRSELYEIFYQRYGVKSVASEYGMTEMFSQCYSKESGRFHSPPHVRILGRELNDPFSVVETGRNKAVNVIDLANIYSCAFLSLSDLCNLYDDGSFEILGRVDMSEVRGCNLMIK